MKKFLSSLKKLFIGQSKFKTNTCSNCTRKQTLFFQNSSLCYSAEDKPFFSNSEMANHELIKGTNVPVIALVALSKKYYDVAGLIEKGQAVDVNSLKVNPYSGRVNSYKNK